MQDGDPVVPHAGGAVVHKVQAAGDRVGDVAQEPGVEVPARGEGAALELGKVDAVGEDEEHADGGCVLVELPGVDVLEEAGLGVLLELADGGDEEVRAAGAGVALFDQEGVGGFIEVQT